jgi:hypothetical protein
MRDTHATGTGSIMGAGTAGYCVGNLQLDGATLPHEDPEFVYPDNLASPQQVCTASCLTFRLSFTREPSMRALNWEHGW